MYIFIVRAKWSKFHLIKLWYLMIMRNKVTITLLFLLLINRFLNYLLISKKKEFIWNREVKLIYLNNGSSICLIFSFKIFLIKKHFPYIKCCILQFSCTYIIDLKLGKKLKENSQVLTFAHQSILRFHWNMFKNKI